MSETTIRLFASIVISAVLLGAWFALVVMGQVPPEGFVTALTGTLAGLGVHGVHERRNGR